MRETRHRQVTLVLGGVRSGKSRYALEIASRAATVTFLATACAGDDEMRRKIERHRNERPAHWRTQEEPLKVAEAIGAEQEATALIVVDCLTLFAANLMQAYGDDRDAVSTAIDELCSALRKTDCDVVLVSNEVGSGVVPEYVSGRQFRDLLGEMNQRVAAIADNVVLMIAGLPLPIKGGVEGLQ